MKLFTKVALVSAIAISGQAMAMQALEDADLSAATGQDGIDIGIGISKLTIGKVYIHDNGGLAPTTTFGTDATNGAYNSKRLNVSDATEAGTKSALTAAPWSAGNAAYDTAHSLAVSAGMTSAQATTYVDAFSTNKKADVIHAVAGQAAAATYAAYAAPFLADGTTINPTAFVDSATSNRVGGTGTSGAIAIDGVTITANKNSLLQSHNLADIKIDTDGGLAADGSGAFLNIGADVSGLNIQVGKISVGRSGAQGTTSVRRGLNTAGGVTAKSNEILSGLTLTTGKMKANIQLGATPQGAMILLNGAIEGGLTISDLGIVDAAGGGQIVVDKIQVADANDINLTTNAKISVTPDGLKINAMSNASDMYITGVHLSGSYVTSGATTSWVKGASIGDVEVQNLNVFNGAAGTIPGAVITIAGH